jgi:hypothetical protein
VTDGRRIGRWRHGDHDRLGMGWRLAETNLVLDHDPLAANPDGISDRPLGAYVLWRDGQPVETVARRLRAAMAEIEQREEEFCRA